MYVDEYSANNTVMLEGSVFSSNPLVLPVSVTVLNDRQNRTTVAVFSIQLYHRGTLLPC